MKIARFALPALLVAGMLPVVATPAYADHSSCGSGHAIIGTAAGTISDANRIDWWTHEGSGMRLVAMADSGGLDYFATDSSCAEGMPGTWCWGESADGVPDKCIISTPGPVNVGVFRGETPGDGAYTLSVTPLVPACAGIVRVCVTMGGPAQQEYLFVPADEAPRDVAAWVDTYRFVTSAGTYTLPCVVAASGTTVNACAALGGTFVARFAGLVNTTATAYAPGEQSYLTKVSVCRATLTATALGFGADAVPAQVVC